MITLGIFDFNESHGYLFHHELGYNQRPLQGSSPSWGYLLWCNTKVWIYPEENHRSYIYIYI
jgi:hypothetical protein